MPPDAITCRRAIGPRRLKLGLNFLPAVRGPLFYNLFFGSQFAWAHRVNKNGGLATGVINPADVKHGKAFVNLDKRRCALSVRSFNALAGFCREPRDRGIIGRARFRAQPFHLRIGLNLSRCRGKEPSVGCQHEGMPGAGERDVKQAFHFLAVRALEFFFQIRDVSPIEDHLITVLIDGANDPRVARRRHAHLA